MAKGLSLEFMEKLNEGLLKEDFAILMQGQRDTKATEKHHIHEQNSELLTKVTGIFGDLAERYGWKKIQLQPTIDETANLIWKVMQLVLDIVSSD